MKIRCLVCNFESIGIDTAEDLQRFRLQVATRSYGEQPEVEILIVDDEASICEILAQFLEKGYEVFTAGSGESALDILSNESIDLGSD